jgi:hypothetical protein
MEQIGTVYRGHTLRADTQSGGGVKVRVVAADGTEIITNTFRELSEALASARKLIDRNVIA